MERNHQHRSHHIDRHPLRPRLHSWLTRLCYASLRDSLTVATALQQVLKIFKYIYGLDIVRRNSKKAWRKTPDNRLEYPEYPERAVEEGLVNALIHRNYMELGSEVHIDMYDDRLEIYSHGGLMDGGCIKEMDVMNMSSHHGNPVVADIFSRLK